MTPLAHAWQLDCEAWHDAQDAVFAVAPHCNGHSELLIDAAYAYSNGRLLSAEYREELRKHRSR